MYGPSCGNPYDADKMWTIALPDVQKPPVITPTLPEVKGAHFIVTSIYAVQHIGIALSSHFVASVSVVVTLCIPDSVSKMACQI